MRRVIGDATLKETDRAEGEHKWVKRQGRDKLSSQEGKKSGAAGVQELQNGAAAVAACTASVSGAPAFAKRGTPRRQRLLELQPNGF
jgi:hypothetical protein